MLDASLVTTLIGLLLAVSGIASMTLLLIIVGELRRIRAAQEALLESLRFSSRETSAALSNLAAVVSRTDRSKDDLSLMQYKSDITGRK